MFQLLNKLFSFEHNILRIRFNYSNVIQAKIVVSCLVSLKEFIHKPENYFNDMS